MTLKEGTTLQNGKYVIKRVLGQGGFGITYLAEHKLLGTNVAIKEFFMKDMNNRDTMTSMVSVGAEGSQELVEKFKTKFLKEARNIFRLNHPNIVKIHDIFEENGTAYFVMDYCERGSLSDLLKHYPDGISEEKALTYIRQIASAVAYIHEQKMNHLDIKPGNVVINAQEEAVLIDFGLSKQYDAITGQQTSTTPVGISHGYAPYEQYNNGGVKEFSPSTDIYSLGATLYKLITGKTPLTAQELIESELPEFNASANVVSAIKSAMKLKRVDRPQSISAWLDMFNAKDVTEETVVIVSPPKEPSITPDSRLGPVIEKKQSVEDTPESNPLSKPSAKTIWGIIVVLVVVIVGFLVFTPSSTHQTTNSTMDNSPVLEDFEGFEQTESHEEITSTIGTPDNSDISTTGILNGHEWVNLGLSVKWATCNVGANKPSDFGGYYAWGETRTKSLYELNNYFDNNKSEKCWITYKKGGKIKIDPDSGHDTARENWGSSWRMPTNAENEELCKKCTWEWTSRNGHSGYVVIGPNGNSIFLPAAGARAGTDYEMGLGEENEHGRYWSSCLDETFSSKACSISFSYRHYETSNYAERRFGYSVRPVTE